MGISLPKGYIAAAVAALLFPLWAYGQFVPLSEARFVMSPEFPEPNSVVSIELNAYSVDTSGATITWYIDGAEVTESRNERNITVPLGDIGEERVVRAVIHPLLGSPITVTKTITPAALDLIIESETNVPSFYRGRALPGQGSPIRVIAFFYDGSASNPSELTYSWQLNRKALFGGPVRGKFAADIIMPDYTGALLSVSVADESGTVIGKKMLTLSGTDPELYFYEVNPLRGLQRRAVTNSYVLLGEETTFRAEPYFINTDAKEAARYTWRLDGKLVETAQDDPSLITLRKEGGAGNARIGFEFVNPSQLSQYVKGSFMVLFE